MLGLTNKIATVWIVAISIALIVKHMDTLPGSNKSNIFGNGVFFKVPYGAVL